MSKIRPIKKERVDIQTNIIKDVVNPRKISLELNFDKIFEKESFSKKENLFDFD